MFFKWSGFGEREWGLVTIFNELELDIEVLWKIEVGFKFKASFWPNVTYILSFLDITRSPNHCH